MPLPALQATVTMHEMECPSLSNPFFIIVVVVIIQEKADGTVIRISNNRPEGWTSLQSASQSGSSIPLLLD